MTIVVTERCWGPFAAVCCSVVSTMRFLRTSRSHKTHTQNTAPHEPRQRTNARATQCRRAQTRFSHPRPQRSRAAGARAIHRSTQPSTSTRPRAGTWAHAQSRPSAPEVRQTWTCYGPKSPGTAGARDGPGHTAVPSTSVSSRTMQDVQGNPHPSCLAQTTVRHTARAHKQGRTCPEPSTQSALIREMKVIRGGDTGYRSSQ